MKIESAFCLMALSIVLASCGPEEAANAQPSQNQASQPSPSPTAGDPVSSAPASKKPVASTPTPGDSAVSNPAPSKLPPLDLSDMHLWNWNGLWHASEWGTGYTAWRKGLGQGEFKYDHVQQQADQSVRFVLDNAGQPQLKAMDQPAQTAALFETDVTLPELRPGLVVAPLWLYNEDSKDEIDFETVGTQGIDLTLHHYDESGKYHKNAVRILKGEDLSGRRMTFGIRIDLPNKIEMLIDGKRVHTWTAAELGWFPNTPVKPIMEMWAGDPNYTDFVQWLGKWEPMGDDEQLVMTVHGYRSTVN